MPEHHPELEAVRGPNGATVIRRWPDGPTQEICTVNSFRDMTEPVGETAEAIRFAFLFAAAPELLAACELCLERTEVILDGEMGPALQNAITKAKGA